jgi:hypothetical protein
MRETWFDPPALLLVGYEVLDGGAQLVERAPGISFSSICARILTISPNAQ